MPGTYSGCLVLSRRGSVYVSWRTSQRGWAISPRLLEKADQDTESELRSSEMEFFPHLGTGWAEMQGGEVEGFELPGRSSQGRSLFVLSLIFLN